jgi:solute:Na+ symporter, SSS family
VGRPSGIGYSAIVIGALAPAAIMSIAAANLFTRNIYKEFFRPDATPAHETRVAQTVSLTVKAGALVFVLALSKTFSINLQLLGGGLDPADLPGHRDRPLQPLVPPLGAGPGLDGAMVYGTVAAYNTPAAGVPGSHFGSSVALVPLFNHTVYIALTALVINLVVAAVLTVVFRAAKLPAGSDETAPGHYLADPEPAPGTPSRSPRGRPTPPDRRPGRRDGREAGWLWSAAWKVLATTWSCCPSSRPAARSGTRRRSASG